MLKTFVLRKDGNHCQARGEQQKAGRVHGDVFQYSSLSDWDKKLVTGAIDDHR